MTPSWKADQPNVQSKGRKGRGGLMHAGASENYITHSCTDKAVAPSSRTKQKNRRKLHKEQHELKSFYKIVLLFFYKHSYMTAWLFAHVRPPSGSRYRSLNHLPLVTPAAWDVELALVHSIVVLCISGSLPLSNREQTKEEWHSHGMG